MSSDLPTSVSAQDPREILSWFEEKPTLSRYVGAVRRFDQLHDVRPNLFSDRSILVVRNFTVEPIEPFLRLAAYRAGVCLRVTYTGYDPAVDAVVSEVAAGDQEVVLLALRLEDLTSAITVDFLATKPADAHEIANRAVDRVVDLARGIRSRTRAAVLAHNFVTPVSPVGGIQDSQDPAGQLSLVRRMNLMIAEQIHVIDGAHVVDVDHLFSELGLRDCYDRRGDRTSGAPLSQLSLRALADCHVRHLKALQGPAVKCVIVDCDNTLWGGVIGEEGVAGIVLGDSGEGRRFQDFQRDLLNLRRRGTLLAICSKNEEADVLEVLRTHPDCILSEEDFATHRINWTDKADNIQSIVGELNLGLDHIVFIDDNPVECEWVSSRLPAVRVLKWPEDLEGADTLDDLLLFDSLAVTDEDRGRTEMYRAEGLRRSAREEAPSFEDYLRSLDMRATVGSARPEHLPRVAQLTQRTNQFNLTTRRYDVAALGDLADSAHAAVVWLDLRDHFGGHGIVGCGILRTAGPTAIIDTLLLSCRVLGREVEVVLVNRLARAAVDMGASVLVGQYLPSARNGQVADLYSRLGFDGPDGEEEGQTWRWSLAAGPPAVPDWFEIIDADSRES